MHLIAIIDHKIVSLENRQDFIDLNNAHFKGTHLSTSVKGLTCGAGWPIIMLKADLTL